MTHQFINQELPENAHERRLLQALADTGNFSFGVSAIEFWVLNNKKTRLVRPEGAYWRDPAYEFPQYIDEESCKDALRQLEDTTYEHYLEPRSLQLGIGLAGQLWAEKTTTVRASEQSISDFGSFHGVGNRRRSSFSSFTKDSLLRLSFGGAGNNNNSSPRTDEALIWRGLQFIACDPDHIPDERLKAFLKAGLGKVAGCSFESPYSKGIALFYAKSDVKKEALEDQRNDEFLRRSVPMIGSMLALSDSMVDSWENKQEDIALTQKLKNSADFVTEILQSDEESQTDEECEIKVDPSLVKLTKNNKPQRTVNRLWHRIVMMINKTFDLDSSAKAPPPMPNSECIWTFVGSFLTLIAVTFTSQSLNFWTDKQYAIPLGPMGALTTLLFGLSSAPASQPKSALYGPIIAGSTGLVLSYIPPYLFNLRLALSASVSITMMAKLGVVHPPAGALAVMLVIDDEFHWGSLLQYVIGVIVAISLATVVNNLNEKRTYPQYWNMLHSSITKHPSLRRK